MAQVSIKGNIGKSGTFSSVRWRGDRSKREWPRELYGAGPFLWTGDNIAPQKRRSFVS